MKLKKKILVLGLCGVMSVFPVMSASAVGEDGIAPLAEACPQCSLGNFVLQNEWHYRVGSGMEACGECERRHDGSECACVPVEYWHHEQEYVCDRCGFKDNYVNVIRTELDSCRCYHESK